MGQRRDREARQGRDGDRATTGTVNDGDLVTVEPLGDRELAVGDVVLVRCRGHDYLHMNKARQTESPAAGCCAACWFKRTADAAMARPSGSTAPTRGLFVDAHVHVHGEASAARDRLMAPYDGAVAAGVPNRVGRSVELLAADHRSRSGHPERDREGPTDARTGGC
jgi:hypothetical protein